MWCQEVKLTSSVKLHTQQLLKLEHLKSSNAIIYDHTYSHKISILYSFFLQVLFYLLFFFFVYFIVIHRFLIYFTCLHLFSSLILFILVPSFPYFHCWQNFIISGDIKLLGFSLVLSNYLTWVLWLHQDPSSFLPSVASVILYSCA